MPVNYWEKETFLIPLKIQNKNKIAVKSCIKSLPFWQLLGIEVEKHLEGTSIGRLTYTNNVINSAQHSLRTEIQCKSCHIPDGAELWFPASVQLGMFGVTVHLEYRWLLGTRSNEFVVSTTFVTDYSTWRWVAKFW